MNTNTFNLDLSFLKRIGYVQCNACGLIMPYSIGAIIHDCADGAEISDPDPGVPGSYLAGIPAFALHAYSRRAKIRG
jgi:hypothetical protein